MAYNTQELIDSKVPTLSLTGGCETLKTKFKNEKEFTINLLPKLDNIIKEMYNLDIDTVQLEKYFRFNDVGYYNIKADIYIKTKQGRDILIECKNPIHDKSELSNVIGQLVSYQFLLSQTPEKPIIILATSVMKFWLFEIIKSYNLKFDIIINNENSAAFWVNEF